MGGKATAPNAPTASPSPVAASPGMQGASLFPTGATPTTPPQIQAAPKPIENNIYRPGTGQGFQNGPVAYNGGPAQLTVPTPSQPPSLFGAGSGIRNTNTGVMPMNPGNGSWFGQ